MIHMICNYVSGLTAVDVTVLSAFEVLFIVCGRIILNSRWGYLLGLFGPLGVVACALIRLNFAFLDVGWDRVCYGKNVKVVI